jgi:hypothetical protein
MSRRCASRFRARVRECRLQCVHVRERYCVGGTESRCAVRSGGGGGGGGHPPHDHSRPSLSAATLKRLPVARRTMRTETGNLTSCGVMRAFTSPLPSCPLLHGGTAHASRHHTRTPTRRRHTTRHDRPAKRTHTSTLAHERTCSTPTRTVRRRRQRQRSCGSGVAGGAAAGTASPRPARGRRIWALILQARISRSPRC